MQDTTHDTTQDEREEELTSEPKPILSQRDYVPTPYQDSEWEIVGERLTDLNFNPLVMEVIREERAAPDPMFEVFDGDTPLEITKQRHAPGKERFFREELGNDVQDTVDPEILRAERKAGFEEGRAEGFREGEEAAKRVIEERYEQLQHQVSAIDRDLQVQFAALKSQLEKSALQLALAVAKKILITTAEVKPDYIFDVIRRALHEAGAGKPLRIRVSVEDFEFLNVIGLPPELSREETGITYVSDESIKSGCVVETDFGEIDLQLERMWEQVREHLYEVTK